LPDLGKEPQTTTNERFISLNKAEKPINLRKGGRKLGMMGSSMRMNDRNILHGSQQSLTRAKFVKVS